MDEHHHLEVEPAQPAGLGESRAALFWGLSSLAATAIGTFGSMLFLVFTPVFAAITVFSFVRQRSPRGVAARLGVGLAVLSILLAAYVVGSALRTLSALANDPAWRR